MESCSRGPASAIERGRVIILTLSIAACGGTPVELAPPEGDSSTSSAAADGSTGTEPPPTDGADTGIDASVTYHADLRPVIERHCVGCHQPGNIGPFPMTSYEEVHALREAIVLSVDSGTMPPWLAGEGCRDYVGDPSMSPEEIELFSAWVDEGAVEGDPEDYVAPEIPPPPGMSRIDLTLELPEPYEPRLQPDDYRCFLLDWPYEQTSYISGFEAVPDQLQMVHHMIAFAISPDQAAEYDALDAAEPGAGYTCFGGPGGEIDPLDPSSVGSWLGSWAPGGFAGDFPEGTGIPVEPGSRVVLQVHYNTGGVDIQPDQSAVRFKVDEQVDRPAAMLPWANPEWLAGGMTIPAGDDSVVHSFELDPTLFMSYITDAIPSGVPFRIYAAAHHMHDLGTKGQQTIERADGSQTCLLDVPRWDFNWQQDYRFGEPELFNPGDALRIECEWNNEAGEHAVNWGEGTGDEMCLGIFYATAL